MAFLLPSQRANLSAFAAKNTPSLTAAPTRSLTAPPPTAALAGPAPLPPDPTFEATVGGLTARRDRTISGLGTARTQSLLDFGFTPQTDAAGKVTGLTFDPSNPFSRAALLRRNFQQARTGNVNSYAARGQLYAGSLQNAQNETNFKEQQGENAIETALLRFLANNSQAVADAGTDFETGVAQAAATRVANAPASPLYEPAASAPPPAPAAAPAAAAGAHGALVQSIPNYKSPTGRIGTLHVYADGTRVFVVK